MHIPLSWISLYSNVQPLLKRYSIPELAHLYSIHTAEVDDIHTYFLDKVVIGKVISCEKHPDSKKLSIVQVDLGKHGKEQILTGAANIIHAKYVAVAVVGAVLPGDFTIGERMMAGYVSRGMICSDDELGLASERSEGIMILEETWKEKELEEKRGESFFDLALPFPGLQGKPYNYPLRDVTFEIDNKFITNRPDLFSVIGNAREFHAVFQTGFTPYSSEREIPTTNKLSTNIESDRVFSYHLMKMEDIKVGKSPMGIHIMMERAGLASKMDIVDITNLMMSEFGQPMHAFDADKVQGNISVRLAKSGETIMALNNVEYTLTDDDLVIADESGPIAIAGVIGGLDSAVSENTKNIIWESACFDAVSVRKTAQRHGVRTDASTRYEKSLDPLLAGTTFPRIIEYMEFLGKPIKISGISRYMDNANIRNIEIESSVSFLQKKIGAPISEKQMKDILERLDFSVTEKGENFIIKVPSHRASKDVNIAEDIAEEVGRVYGYDHIAIQPLTSEFSIAKRNPETTLRDTSLQHWSHHGWNEVYNYSFTNEELDKKIGYPNMDDAILVQNAFNEEYTHMRRSLAPRLLLNIAENLKHSSTLAFFELGKIYSKDIVREEGCRELLTSIPASHHPLPEKKMIAGGSTGKGISELREDIESYLRATLGYVPPVHQGSGGNKVFHPGVSGSYRLGENTLVRFGQIHPEVASNFEILESTLYFEIDYTSILKETHNKDEIMHSISRFQSIPRELNFILPTHTPTGDIARIIDAVHPWISDIRVDSVYEDDAKIGTEKKSVNFAFRFLSHDDTINDEQALEVQNLIISEMRKHGYPLRGEE